MKTLRLQERLDALRTILATPPPPPSAPRCGDCRWMSAYPHTECRRHAPAPNSRAGDARLRIYPVVDLTDWCGDYEAGATCPH